MKYCCPSTVPQKGKGGVGHDGSSSDDENVPLGDITNFGAGDAVDVNFNGHKYAAKVMNRNANGPYSVQYSTDRTYEDDVLRDTR